MADYGERFETATIVAMSIAIIVSLIAVVAMNVAASSDCDSSTYTYCGEIPAPAPH